MGLPHWSIANVVNIGAEITFLISEGPWIFVGVRNAVKVSSYFSPLFLSLSQSCLICRIITCKPIMWLWLQRLGMFRLLHILLLMKGQFLSMVVGNDTLFCWTRGKLPMQWFMVVKLFHSEFFFFFFG